jgi:hypothetical protein
MKSEAIADQLGPEATDPPLETLHKVGYYLRHVRFDELDER